MSETHTLINPFELLGFDSKKPNINLKELKKNYYNLALLCHPDKGGNQDDMIMLQTAYTYVKKQVELSNEKTQDFEECLDEFETFMKDQTEVPLPFSEVYEEAHVWLQEFNTKFHDHRKLDDDVFGYDPNQDGYGSFMDQSEHDASNSTIPEYKTNHEEFQKHVQHAFDWELTESEHPESYSSIQDHGEFYDLKQKTIDNFSRQTDTLNMTDYRMAFTSAEVSTTKTQKIERGNVAEFEEHLEKLKAERYVLDSELDEQEIVKSFVMLDDQEIKEQPKIKHTSSRKKWF